MRAIELVTNAQKHRTLQVVERLKKTLDFGVVNAVGDGLGAAQDAAAEAGRDVVRARAELDALDVDIAAQSALVSEHDMRITALRGTAEAAASALAAVRTAVERQQKALDAALARRAEAEELLAGLDPHLMPETTAAEHAAAYERAQREANEVEANVASLRERLHAAEREKDALTAQTTALANERTAVDLRNRRLTASVLLIRPGAIRCLSAGSSRRITPACSWLSRLRNLLASHLKM